jgi:DNA polymerase III epsilon subunit-like protein
MELKEIKNFLHSKPGYLKEGGKRLRRVLLVKGFQTTIALCKEAIRQVNKEIKFKEFENLVEGEGKILIYDIETSPNLGWFWRAGYKLNIQPGQITQERAIICLSYKWAGEDQVYNLAWDKDQDDKFLIEQFIEVLNEADLIVAHNGDNFDIKWLKTRALYHRLHGKMLTRYNQFDTLKVAKSKLYLNSNRLDYIAKFLGFKGKIRTRYDLWDDVCMKNDREALQEMIDYCDEDVIQLEHIYNEIKYLDNPRIHAGVLNGETKQTSPISGGTNLQHLKVLTTNRGTVKHVMKDLDNNRLFEMSDTNYKKYLLVQ